jgi:hypothetical protein
MDVSAPIVFDPKPGFDDAGPAHSWVYFIKSHDFMKIGRANKLATRLQRLQTGNPHPCTVEEVIRVPRKQALRYETSLHRTFAKVRHRGEWFRFEPPLSSYVELLKKELHVFNQHQPHVPGHGRAKALAKFVAKEAA